MVFEINEIESNWIEEAYNKSMEELDKFFELNWKFCRPKLILVPDRKTINALKNTRTEGWYVAWAEGKRIIFILNPKNYESESTHKFSKEEYIKLIKHELAHCFSGVISKGECIPSWLGEGIAIYLSGQLDFKKRPDKILSFLDYFDKCDKGVYKESGFAVEFLVDNYGKEKFIELLKNLRKIDSEDSFKKLFNEIYGFELNYDNFNK